jgi:hypothetical protein
MYTQVPPSASPNRIMWPSCWSALFQSMGLQPSDGKVPHPLLWAGSLVASRKLTASRVPNSLNYCEIIIVYTKFRNVVVGRIIQPGGPRVGDPCFKGLTEALLDLSKVTTYVLMTSGFASNTENYITVKKRKGILINRPILNPY